MSIISLPGLGTGIDTSAIVRQLVAAESTRVTRLQQQRATWENKASALSTLQTRVESFKTAAEALRVAADLRAYTITSNNQEVLTAEATSAAGEGSHTVVIDRLAAANRQVHTGLATLDTTVGEGVFAYTYNGQARSLQTTANTTLENLRDLINNDSGNPGVTASLLEYDAGGGHVYHLVLGGNDTGADYTVAVDDDLTTIAGFDSADFTETQAAQDARVRIDGYPSDDWILRSSNAIDDVLPGVTLHLHTTGTVTVSLTRDTQSLKSKINTLIGAYNAVVSYAKQTTKYDTATKTAAVLMGEHTVNDALYQLRLPFIQTAAGFLSGADAYTLAAQVGLSANDQGQLELDEEVFDEAVSDNYLGVLSLLGARQTGASDSNELKFYSASTITAAGAYDVEATFTDGVLVSARIKKTTESAWRDATVNGNLILGVNGNPEQALQVTATHAGTGTVAAVVRVRQGIGGALYDSADHLIDETISTTHDRYQDAVDSLDDRIAREQDRVTQYEDRLNAQFARLERALTLINAQLSALTASGLLGTSS